MTHSSSRYLCMCIVFSDCTCRGNSMKWKMFKRQKAHDTFVCQERWHALGRNPIVDAFREHTSRRDYSELLLVLFKQFNVVLGR